MRFSLPTGSAVGGLLLLASAVAAAERPLPTFSDGTPAVVEQWFTGVINRGRMETDFLCTVTGSTPTHVGVEVYDAAGRLQNDIEADVGAILDVGPGQTVTIGTSGSKALLETLVIPLGAIAQGSARVVASAAEVRCSAVIVDNAVTPPVALGTLAPPRQTTPGGILARALPTFPGGRQATHAALFPGLIKRGRMETEIFCTSLADEAVDIGVEVFASSGSALNNVSSGNGAVTRVAASATVTIGTSGTASYLESNVIVLPAVSQGLARVVTTSGRVWCSAMVLDAGVTPPVSMSELRGFAGAAAPPATSTPTATATASATATPRPPTPTPTAMPTQPPLPCTGDCSADGTVTVDEIVQGVNIALGAAPASACPPFDRSQDGEVTVDEILQAVAAALSGCQEVAR